MAALLLSLSCAEGEMWPTADQQCYRPVPHRSNSQNPVIYSYLKALHIMYPTGNIKVHKTTESDKHCIHKTSPGQGVKSQTKRQTATFNLSCVCASVCVCEFSNEDRAEDLHSLCACASLCRGFTHSSSFSCMMRSIRSEWGQQNPQVYFLKFCMTLLKSIYLKYSICFFNLFLYLCSQNWIVNSFWSGYSSIFSPFFTKLNLFVTALVQMFQL